MMHQHEPHVVPEVAETEAHGLKEVAATGISATALLAAGAGAAAAAAPAGEHAAAKPTYEWIKTGDRPAAKADPTLKIRDSAANPTYKLAKKTAAANKLDKTTDAMIKGNRAGTRINSSLDKL